MTTKRSRKYGKKNSTGSFIRKKIFVGPSEILQNIYLFFSSHALSKTHRFLPTIKSKTNQKTKLTFTNKLKFKLANQPEHNSEKFLFGVVN
jgi:hypothetical protein